MFHPRHIPTSIALAIGLIVAILGGAPGGAAAATPTAIASPAAAPAPTAADASAARSPASATPSAGATAIAPAAAVDPAAAARARVIAYLSGVIGWSRHLTIEVQTAHDPVEILFVADDRQMAGEVLTMAFEYARAAADLIRADSGAQNSAASIGAAAAPGPHAGVDGTDYNQLVARRAQAQAAIDASQAHLKDLRARLQKAAKHDRDRLTREIVAAQGELDLAQSHVDSLNALIEFEGGAGLAATGVETGLSGQIDVLERSVRPAAVTQAQAAASTLVAGAPAPAISVPAAAPAAASAPSDGFFGSLDAIMRLKRKDQAIADAMALTRQLTAATETQRAPLLATLHDIDQQGVRAAAATASSDIATLRQSQQLFQALNARHKLVSSAILPLAKTIVLVNLYNANLERWRTALSSQVHEELRMLMVRLLGLGALLAIVFAGAFIWRALTFRYVVDLSRRHQLMQVRRLAVAVIIALILIFDFANELGTLGTVMGFAAAGIAITLQNVILSFAGYFYLSGRFGVRVGERVQLSGITGDVLETGLLKLTLMELSEDADGRQPTGRVVVFPNSTVFQPNGNFFKQIPGSNYSWNELRLTLAPDCDYRLAEKRLEGVVGAVFARYRDAVQRDYRNTESTLNVRFETPRPQSRLRLGTAGLEIIVRYPVPLQSAVQSADEIARRLVDAIDREPGLRLAMQGTPALQSVAARAAGEGASPADPSADHSDASGATGPADPNTGLTPIAQAAAGAAGVAAGVAAATAVSEGGAPAAPPAAPVPPVKP